MQDPSNPPLPHARKPWYQRAMEIATQWKPNISKPIEMPTINNLTKPSTTTLLKKYSKSTTDIPTKRPTDTKLRKCTSLRVATSFTRVCLCAPISSYNEVFRADHPHIPHRKSYTYPTCNAPVKPLQSSGNNNNNNGNMVTARISTEQRRVFRGKSLRDDVLMRRFVVEEEAMMQVIRRRNQMEVIRRRSLMMKRRKKLGPSPLSRMVIAEVNHEI